MKKTAKAFANIAFIKYWGKKDDRLRLPANGSLSMNLDQCSTVTTVEFSQKYKEDTFEIIGEEVSGKERVRISAFLSKLREMKGENLFAKVVSQNSFPKDTGIASSASGFAALSLAASKALGLDLSEKKLSILARIGSGSACRSIPAGFVEWKEGNSNNSSYAYSLYPPSYWSLLDILIIVSSGGKKITSTEGQEKSRETSPFYKTRISRARELLSLLKEAFARRNFRKVGEIIEEDCLNMHAVMMTTKPALFYWLPETLLIIKNIYYWREEGIPVYFTIDAGPNVHLICEEKNKGKILEKVRTLQCIKSVIINKPAKGAHLIDKHLF